MFIAKDDEAKINPVLTTLSIAYPQTGLVAEDIFPVANVDEDQEDGTYFLFDKSNLQGGIDDRRALGAPASTFDWKLKDDSYHCEEHTLEKPIDWREFKKFKRYLDLAKTTMEIALEILLLNREARVADICCSESTYPNADHYITLAGTEKFSDFVNSDPEGVIEDARDRVSLDAAEPNTIAVPINVWRTIRRHPAIRSLMKEPDSRQLTEDGFPKRLWGMKAIFPGARQNTVMPGASENIARVWGNKIWLGVVNPRPALRVMSFGYTIRSDGQKVETYEDKKRKSDVVRVQHQIACEKVVCSYAGYLIEDVL